MKIYTLTLLISYAVINLIIYSHYSVMVYDEAWFSCCFSYKEVTNHLGYGYLYWLFIGLIKSTLVLRLIAFISMMSIPFILYRFSQIYNLTPFKSNSIILLWLTFPAAWWYGKLIAPEIYCLALAFFGLYLSITTKTYKIRKYCGMVLMGISFGIKITFIIIPIFYCLHSLLTFYQKVEKTPKSFISGLKHYLFDEEKFGIFFIIGFLVGTPSLIFNPAYYLTNLLKFSSENIDLWKLQFLYSENLGTFWETVLSPSLTKFSISTLSLAILIIALILQKGAFKDKKYCTAS